MRSFNGSEPGGPELIIRKQKRQRKRLIFFGLSRKTIKLLTQSLRRSWRHQAPSWGGQEGTVCLLERVLEAQAGESARRVSMFQRISRRERERERKKERKTQAPKLWWNKGVLFNIVWVYILSSVQFGSVAQSCPTICDPMNHSTPGLPVHHQLPKFTQTHVHRVSDAFQPSHPLSSPSPPSSNPSQHQSLFQWVNSSHEVAKVLEFQL